VQLGRSRTILSCTQERFEKFDFAMTS
jgi:hypothetical protein